MPSSAGPLTVMPYVPTGLAAVAVVDSLGCVGRLASVSPFIKPVPLAVSVGFAAPYALLLFSTVIVNDAGVMLAVVNNSVTSPNV